jgi:hypothetical protein
MSVYTYTSTGNKMAKYDLTYIFFIIGGLLFFENVALGRDRMG